MLLIGDFDIEKCDKPISDLCHIHNLCRLIKVPTFYKNPSKPTCIDLMLTNSPKSYKSCAFETGQSDFHKAIVTKMKTTISKQGPKIIQCRDYKYSSNNAFREDLLLEASSSCHASELDNLLSFINADVKALNKHSPVKRRYFRASQGSFINKWNK